MTKRGLTLWTVSSSRPHSLYVPGMELSIHISACETNWRKISFPRGVERSKVMS